MRRLRIAGRRATRRRRQCANRSTAATTHEPRSAPVLAEEPVQSVPEHLRDKGGQASKRMGHGKGYRYSHDFPEGVSGQDYLEQPLRLYSPKTAGAEAAIAERLRRWGALKDSLSARSAKKLAEGGPRK